MGLDEPIDEGFLKEVVEKPELVYQTANGKENSIKLAYEFVSLSNEVDTITGASYLNASLTATAWSIKRTTRSLGEGIPPS